MLVVSQTADYIEKIPELYMIKFAKYSVLMDVLHRKSYRNFFYVFPLKWFVMERKISTLEGSGKILRYSRHYITQLGLGALCLPG